MDTYVYMWATRRDMMNMLKIGTLILEKSLPPYQCGYRSVLAC